MFKVVQCVAHPSQIPLQTKTQPTTYSAATIGHVVDSSAKIKNIRVFGVYPLIELQKIDGLQILGPHIGWVAIRPPYANNPDRA